MCYYKDLFDAVQPSHGLRPVMIVAEHGGRGGRGYVQPGGGLGLGQLQLFPAAVLFGHGRRGGRRRRRRRAAGPGGVQLQRHALQRQPAVPATDDRGRRRRRRGARVFGLGLYVPVFVFETAPVRGALVLAPGHFGRSHRRRDGRERLETVHDGPEHRGRRDTCNPPGSAKTLRAVHRSCERINV